jgi:hypothetical protein
VNPRSTGLLLLAALGLGAFIYLYELREVEEDDAVAELGRRLHDGLSAGDIDRIWLRTKDGVRVEVARADGSWWITEPLRFHADESALEAIASQLAQLDVEGRVEGERPLADFGLDDVEGELRFRADGQEKRLRLGRQTPVGSSTYVTSVEDGRVAYVSTWRTNALRKTLDELRDRRVIAFDHAAVQEVEVAWPGGGVSIRRDEAGWRMYGPVDAPADAVTVENLLSDLAFLRAEGFVDDPVEVAALGGAGEPVLRIRIEGRDGEGTSFERTLAMHAADPDDPGAGWLGVGTSGVVYRIASERLDDFPRALFAYRFKELARFAVADARRFELIFSVAEGEAPGEERVVGRLEGSDWVTEPHAMAPGRAATLLSELARLTASDVVADGLGAAELAALGLDPPKVRMRVWGAEPPDGQPAPALADLAIGAPQPSLGLLARRADSEVVYGLEASLAEQIPTDFASFSQRFLAAEVAEAAGSGDSAEAARADEAE